MCKIALVCCTIDRPKTAFACLGEWKRKLFSWYSNNIASYIVQQSFMIVMPTRIVYSIGRSQKHTNPNPPKFSPTDSPGQKNRDRFDWPPQDTSTSSPDRHLNWSRLDEPYVCLGSPPPRAGHQHTSARQCMRLPLTEYRLVRVGLRYESVTSHPLSQCLSATPRVNIRLLRPGPICHGIRERTPNCDQPPLFPRKKIVRPSAQKVPSED